MKFFAGRTNSFVRLDLFATYLILTILLVTSCSEDAVDIPDVLEKYVSREVKAHVGDTITTADLVRIIIPSDALEEDGNVFLGRTGDEPQSVPNENLELAVKSVTLRLPSMLINKPLDLQVPLATSMLGQQDISVFLFNGSTYFPVECSIQEQALKIKIDEINWEKKEERIPDSFSELVIMALVNKQTPSQEEKGLKKISVDKDGNMSYAEPTANKNSKVLLMVHGWLSNSERWVKFMQNFNSQEEQMYTEYWAFSYNSSWSIESNARALAEALELHANDAEIDIVAHSMGGLVSRSMLETYGGDKHVNRLVTLGTPHEGSPLAVFRYVIGAFVSMENSDKEMLYNYYSQGFGDLDADSDFIHKMKQLQEPPIPYYTLASTNSAQMIFGKLASEILQGKDDGVVEVSSAKGVPGAHSASNDVQINKDFAHLEMPNDELIFEQVVEYLNDNRD